MNVVLDAAVQFLQVGLLLGLISLHFSLRARLKAIEEKLDRKA